MTLHSEAPPPPIKNVPSLNDDKFKKNLPESVSDKIASVVSGRQNTTKRELF